jgi:hypothetical protein
MLVSLSFSGMMLPGDFQEVHVLYSRQIVNRHSDKKQHFETMSLATPGSSSEAIDITAD